MSSHTYRPSDKILNPSTQSHSSVKDSNLQIQIANSLDIKDLERMNRFKSLYSRLEKEPSFSSTPETISQIETDPISAMQEAQQTYEMMMEIRQQLNQAYQELIKIN